MNEDYPNKDYPWTFYFNGMAMPKWGSSWTFLLKTKRLGAAIRQKEADSDVGPRDFYIIQCRIDHVGLVESADPDIFLYVVQEVLCTLLTEQEAVLKNIRHVLLLNQESAKRKLHDTPVFSGNADDVYADLLEAAFQMRKLSREQHCAFWTSGYEADRLKLIEAMRCAALPSQDPEYAPPPHVKALRWEVEFLGIEQAKLLHSLASQGGISKELRKRLLDI